jgi:hypothetical protein
MTTGQWLIVVAVAFAWGWLTADWRRDSLELSISTAAARRIKPAPPHRPLPVIQRGVWKPNWRRWPMRNRVKFAPKWLSRFLLTCACLMSLSACSTRPQITPDVPYQENLKTKCPETLPRLEGTTGAYVAGVLLEYQNLYSVCAARHNTLVDEINQREK